MWDGPEVQRHAPDLSTQGPADLDNLLAVLIQVQNPTRQRPNLNTSASEQPFSARRSLFGYNGTPGRSRGGELDKRAYKEGHPAMPMSERRESF